jgi:hypothetical protein
VAELIGSSKRHDHRSGRRKVLARDVRDLEAAARAREELGLEQVNDSPQLEEWCREALVGKDKIIADVKAGKTKAVARSWSGDEGVEGQRQSAGGAGHPAALDCGRALTRGVAAPRALMQ